MLVAKKVSPSIEAPKSRINTKGKAQRALHACEQQRITEGGFIYPHRVYLYTLTVCVSVHVSREIVHVKENVIWTRQGADVCTSLGRVVKWRLTSLWRGGNRLLPGNSKHARHARSCVRIHPDEFSTGQRTSRLHGWHFNRENFHFLPPTAPLKSRASITLSITEHNDSVQHRKHIMLFQCLMQTLLPAGKICTQLLTFHFQSQI